MTDEDLFHRIQGLVAKSSEDTRADIATLRKDLVHQVMESERRSTDRFTKFAAEYDKKLVAVTETADGARRRVSDIAELTAAQDSQHDMDAQAREASRIVAEKTMQSQVNTLATGFGDHKMQVASEFAAMKREISQNTNITKEGFASTSKGRKTRTVAGSVTAIGAVVIAVAEMIRVVVPQAEAAVREIRHHSHQQAQP